jgi:hypothetical protein
LCFKGSDTSLFINRRLEIREDSGAETREQYALNLKVRTQETPGWENRTVNLNQRCWTI